MDDVEDSVEDLSLDDQAVPLAIGDAVEVLAPGRKARQCANHSEVQTGAG